MTTTVRYTVINGEIITELRGGRRLYVPDALGSTRALITNTQHIADTFSYWPYGEVNAMTGFTAPPFQFVGTRGYYLDSQGTGTKTYVQARYLDLAKGRWLTKDPIPFQAGDWNPYRYVRNQPVSAVEPIGISRESQRQTQLLIGKELFCLGCVLTVPLFAEYVALTCEFDCRISKERCLECIQNAIKDFWLVCCKNIPCKIALHLCAEVCDVKLPPCPNECGNLAVWKTRARHMNRLSRILRLEVF